MNPSNYFQPFLATLADQIEQLILLLNRRLNRQVQSVQKSFYKRKPFDSDLEKEIQAYKKNLQALEQCLNTPNYYLLEVDVLFVLHARDKIYNLYQRWSEQDKELPSIDQQMMYKECDRRLRSLAIPVSRELNFENLRKSEDKQADSEWWWHLNEDARWERLESWFVALKFLLLSTFVWLAIDLLKTAIFPDPKDTTDVFSHLFRAAIAGLATTSITTLISLTDEGQKASRKILNFFRVPKRNHLATSILMSSIIVLGIVFIALIQKLVYFSIAHILHENSARKYSRAGDNYFNKKQLDLAEDNYINASDKYTIVSRFDPEFSSRSGSPQWEVLLQLGQIYETQGKFDKALENYKLAEKMATKNESFNIATRIAKVYLLQNNQREADNWLWTVASYRRQSPEERAEFFRRNPAAYSVLRDLVSYYLGKEKPSYNDARRWLDLAWTTIEGNSVEQSKLRDQFSIDSARVFLRQKDFAKADEWLRKAVDSKKHSSRQVSELFRDDPYAYSVFKELVSHYLAEPTLNVIAARRWLNQIGSIAVGDDVFKQNELLQLRARLAQLQGQK